MILIENLPIWSKLQAYAVHNLKLAKMKKIVLDREFSLFPTMFSNTSFERVFNPLPCNKIFDMTKLKALGEDKLNVAKMTICVFDREQNTVGKGENAGYQHFLLFLQCFQKPSSLGLLKVGIVW